MPAAASSSNAACWTPRFSPVRERRNSSIACFCSADSVSGGLFVVNGINHSGKKMFRLYRHQENDHLVLGYPEIPAGLEVTASTPPTFLVPATQNAAKTDTSVEVIVMGA